MVPGFFTACTRRLGCRVECSERGSDAALPTRRKEAVDESPRRPAQCSSAERPAPNRQRKDPVKKATAWSTAPFILVAGPATISNWGRDSVPSWNCPRCRKDYFVRQREFAARGYLVASIQQHLPTDPPLMTRVGLSYVGAGRSMKARPIFCLCSGNWKKQPNADYDHLTLVGHSNGGNISMFYAKRHPELMSKVITLDNLSVRRPGW